MKQVRKFAQVQKSTLFPIESDYDSGLSSDDEDFVIDDGCECDNADYIIRGTILLFILIFIQETSKFWYSRV